MSSPIKIIKLALAEDHFLLRESLGKLLNESEGISLVMSVSNGKELLDGIEKNSVDVVLLDLDMPVMNGKEALEILNKQHPKIKAIIFSMYNDSWLVFELMRLGSRSFIPKNSSVDELVKAIKSVNKFGHYFSPDIQWNDRKLSDLALHTKLGMNTKDLELSQLICDGKNSDEIADRFCLSKKSIDLKRAVLLKKLDARNPIDFVRKCLLYGICKSRTDEEIDESDITFHIERKKRKKDRFKN